MKRNGVTHQTTEPKRTERKERWPIPAWRREIEVQDDYWYLVRVILEQLGTLDGEVTVDVGELVLSV